MKNEVVQYLRERADICEETSQTDYPDWNERYVRSYRKAADFIQQVVLEENLSNALLAAHSICEHLKVTPSDFIKLKPQINSNSIKACMYKIRDDAGYEKEPWYLSFLSSFPGKH